MDSPPHTVRTSGTYELEVRRSRFIGAVAPVRDVAAARAFIETRRTLHPSARHHCFAYVVGTGPARAEKASDDGEPSGTGGAPILEVLKKRDVIDAVAVVTRYFGGILLGAGGLIRAYGQAAARALDTAGVQALHPVAIIAVTVPYTHAGKLESTLRESYKLREIHYGTEGTATLTVEVPEPAIPTFTSQIATQTTGTATTTPLTTEYLP